MRSSLSQEEDPGLSSGRKAKVIQGAGEEKFIPWAGVELGRKVYPEGSQSSGSGWRAEPSSAQPEPKAEPCRSQQGQLGWPGVQENNRTLCCLITVLPEEPIKL